MSEGKKKVKIAKLQIALLILTLSVLGYAETTLQVRRAELAIPFGTVEGQLFVVGDYLLFANSKQPENSFAIEKSQIKTLDSEDSVLKVITRVPISDRSGERSELVFRVEESLELDQCLAQSASASAAPEETATRSSQSYAVQHKHRFGDCQGRLMVTDSGLNYESISDLSHSRKWDFSDIKTLKLENPYRLRVEPFNGNGYSLQLQGQGMDSKVYKSLVDRITAARTGF